MKKITKLIVQKKNKNRVNVYIDDQFSFGMSMVGASGLKIGQQLSEEAINQIKDTDSEEIAYQRAINFLSYRPRSVKEIRNNLFSHDISEQIAAKVISRLKHNGLTSDPEFAKLWVENRNYFKPRSKFALGMELRQKGINQDIIDSVLEDIDDTELAKKLAVKVSRKHKNSLWPEYKKKMSGYLSRKGFSYEISNYVIKQLWEEENTVFQE